MNDEDRATLSDIVDELERDRRVFPDKYVDRVNNQTPFSMVAAAVVILAKQELSRSS